MKAAWVTKGQNKEHSSGDVARVMNDAKKIYGYVMGCPCGCGKLAFIFEREDDLFTQGQDCDLTIFRNIQFPCGNIYSLIDGIFGEPK